MKSSLLKSFLLAAALTACPITPLAAQKDNANFTGYLFVYFTGNAPEQEAVCYAVADTSLRFRALNDGQPVILSDTIAQTGGVRDPHILRMEQDEGFLMVCTDMISSKGWDSNRGMVLMKSKDLLHWTHSALNIQQTYENQENLLRVWAPQTIYDAEAGKYMVYFSMKYGNGPDIIYYAYANDDFTAFEDEPTPLFLPADGKSCIDGDIVRKGDTYYLFYKTEGHGNGIKVATTRSLASGQWEETPDYKQQTTDAVEGSGVFPLIGEEAYILMYDVYMKGRYDFLLTNDLEHFFPLGEQGKSVDMDFFPRHGTVIPLTADELARLRSAWP